jgi:hypothetical protein
MDFSKFNPFSSQKKVSPTKTIGVPGTAVVCGYPDIQEKNPRLTGRAQYKTYSDILANTSIVAAGVRYFLNLVAKAKWRVEPADESEAALKLAKIIEGQLHSMDSSWARVVRRAAMYRFYGFSIQEWTAHKNEDGIILMKSIDSRPQQTIERWDTDAHGKVRGAEQINSYGEISLYLPREKIIYIVDDALNDSPTGLGLFRHIVSPANRLARYEQLEGYGFESDLRGIPVGRAPFALLQEAVDSNLITTADKALIEAPITSFITNHIKNPDLGILLDSITYQSQDEAGTPSAIKQWDIELLKGSSTSLADMARAIERVNRDIARTLGVEGLLLGEQTTGSHALSKDKSQNFALIVDSTLTELSDVMRSDLIDRLWELNGWDKKLKPKLLPEAVQHRDITQVTKAIMDLANSGAPLMLNDPAVNEIRRQLGLSEQPTMTQEELDQAKGSIPAKPNDKVKEDGTAHRES